jgi:hypothetical protein
VEIFCRDCFSTTSLVTFLMHQGSGATLSVAGARDRDLMTFTLRIALLNDISLVQGAILPVSWDFHDECMEMVMEDEYGNV